MLQHTVFKNTINRRNVQFCKAKLQEKAKKIEVIIATEAFSIDISFI